MSVPQPNPPDRTLKQKESSTKFYHCYRGACNRYSKSKAVIQTHINTHPICKAETEAKQNELLELFPFSTLEQRKIRTKPNFYCHLCKYSYTFAKYWAHLLPETPGSHGEELRPTEIQLQFMDQYLAGELVGSNGRPYSRHMTEFRYTPDSQ